MRTTSRAAVPGDRRRVTFAWLFLATPLVFGDSCHVIAGYESRRADMSVPHGGDVSLADVVRPLDVGADLALETDVFGAAKDSNHPAPDTSHDQGTARDSAVTLGTCAFPLTQGPFDTVRVELYRSRGAFESRLSDCMLIVDFDDIDTSGVSPVA